MTRRIAGKTQARTTVASAPSRRFVAAGRAPQEHPVLLKHQQGIVALQPAHGAVKMTERAGQQPRRSDGIRCRCDRPRGKVFDVDRHDLNVSFPDCHLLDAVGNAYVSTVLHIKGYATAGQYPLIALVLTI